jgi:hypothetical protein
VTLSELRGETVVLYFYPPRRHAGLHHASLRGARPWR